MSMTIRTGFFMNKKLTEYEFSAFSSERWPFPATFCGAPCSKYRGLVTRSDQIVLDTAQF
jgi:hypothetical protein